MVLATKVVPPRGMESRVVAMASRVVIRGGREVAMVSKGASREGLMGLSREGLAGVSRAMEVAISRKVGGISLLLPE